MGFVFVRKWFDFVHKAKTCVFCPTRQIKCVFLYSIWGFIPRLRLPLCGIAQRQQPKSAAQVLYFLLPPAATFFLNSEGLTSNCFLKHTLKYFALLKPV